MMANVDGATQARHDALQLTTAFSHHNTMHCNVCSILLVSCSSACRFSHTAQHATRTGLNKSVPPQYGLQNVKDQQQELRAAADTEMIIERRIGFYECVCDMRSYVKRTTHTKDEARTRIAMTRVK